MSNQPAIILITCDELNKDVLSCFGGRQYQLLMREAIGGFWKMSLCTGSLFGNQAG